VCLFMPCPRPVTIRDMEPKFHTKVFGTTELVQNSFKRILSRQPLGPVSPPKLSGFSRVGVGFGFYPLPGPTPLLFSSLKRRVPLFPEEPKNKQSNS
jgi:hypothetical protein